MIALIIILMITSTILFIMLTAYRRQVKKTCRHLEFIINNKTNMRIPVEVPFEEMNEMVRNMNKVLDEMENLKKETARDEQNLKNAITNISHDIRTPLTSLDGYFQLLSRAENEDERGEYTAIIRKRIDSLKNMLEELFMYTKLQNQEYSFKIEKMDLKECFCDTLFMFYNDFNEKGIEPKIDVCDDPVFINGNVEATQRMVQNLTKNILEHGCREVDISLTTVGNEVSLVFRNKVENIKDIEVDKVFEQFYKADRARTHSSTGLGLAIAKGLVERMNGTMRAYVDGEEGWFVLRVVFQTA